MEYPTKYALGAAALLMGLLMAASSRGDNSTQATVADAVAAEAGYAILEKNCARCHAIGADGESTHKDAPPFRVVVTKYPPETLAEALAEGISPGHPDMPLFVFEADEISQIIAYLETLRPAASR